MKGVPEVITSLNECLLYFHTAFIVLGIQAAVSNKWGYEEVNQYFKYLSKENVENCEKIIDKILFLDAEPIFDKLDEFPPVAETIEEMFVVCKNLSLKNISYITEAIDISTKFKDFGTRHLVEKMLVEEEKHLATIEAKMIQFSERGKA